MRRLGPGLLLALLLVANTAVQAQDGITALNELDDAALLEALWNERGADLSVFDDDFRAAVPDARLREIIGRAVDELGAAQSVEKAKPANRYTLTTATHDVPIDLVRDGTGRISGLLLRPPIARDDSLERALAALRVDGVESAWLLLRDGERVDAHAPDRPLAIASAFKLWVLDAYRRAVADGELKRDDVVRVEAHHRSWPSGLLQDAPVGLPVTLETLATLMMSLSDNTATDVLIDVLGRERVEAGTPFDPLLATRELFALRLDPALERRYADAEPERRREILASLEDTALPAEPTKPPAPLPGVEWYASSDALCEVIDRVADEPATSVPTGLIDRDGWARVTDKGGSEAGVLSATALVRAEDGTTWCLSATWNGEPDADGRPRDLDELVLHGRLASVVALLARESETP